MQMRDELDIPMPRMAPAEPVYRVPRPRDSIDPATKRLALIGGGIAGVLLLIGAAWSLTGHHAGGGVPVVQADSRPLRTKPVNAGGMQVDGQNDTILSGATDGKESLAPPPETPAPQTLKDEAAQQLAARQATAAAPAPKPDPSPVQPVSASSAVPAAPTPAVAAITDQPEASASSAHSAGARMPTAHPTALNPPAASPAVVAAAPLSSLGGSAAVQLAALASEQSALVEWQRLTHKMPDLLGGRRPSVQRTDAHGKTYYRLRTGGFADVAQATAFCQQVRAKGGGCELARF